MAASFEAYIDESGCEGFKFGPNASSTWFVLTALVVRKTNSHRLVTLLDEVRAHAGIRPRKAVHFRKLSHDQKLFYCSRIASAPVRIISVIIPKSKLDASIFKGGSLLYFYATKLLIERISWLARDHRSVCNGGDGTVELWFSKRKTTPYHELKAYLGKLFDDRCHNESIDWSALRADQIEAEEHTKRAGLQVADACAHATWRRFEKDRRMVEYFRALDGVFYRKRSKVNGYGLKVWPAGAELLLEDAA